MSCCDVTIVCIVLEVTSVRWACVYNSVELCYNHLIQAANMDFEAQNVQRAIKCGEKCLMIPGHFSKFTIEMTPTVSEFHIMSPPVLVEVPRTAWPISWT